jgi:hypothetical protein
MDSGTPPQPDNSDWGRYRVDLVNWSQGAGVTLALVTLICSLARLISAQQSIALLLTTALLTVGSALAVARHDEEAAHALGVRVGHCVGSLVRRLRKLLRRGNEAVGCPRT